MTHGNGEERAGDGLETEGEAKGARGAGTGSWLEGADTTGASDMLAFCDGDLLTTAATFFGCRRTALGTVTADRALFTSAGVDDAFPFRFNVIGWCSGRG